MNYADRACELECVKGEDGNRREFVGPVKIILVDPSPQDYQRKTWGSAFFTLAMLLIGATVFTVFFFTLRFKLPFVLNVHILLCTMGFQLFLPSGILMVNSLFGGAAYLKAVDKKLQHIFLQVCAIGCGVTGSALVLLEDTNYTPHSYTGLAATALILCTSLIGPIVLFSNQAKACGQFNKKVHIIFALLTFLLSTLSFILGLLKESFVEWEPVQNLHIILIGFTFIYSIAIVLSIFITSRNGL